QCVADTTPAQRDIWRRSQHETAQNSRHTADFALISGVTHSVLGAELGDLAFRAPLSREQIAAIRQRQEILHAAFDDAQAVIVQLQVGNNLRLQQADRVSRCRVAKSGMKFFRDTSTADNAAAL